MKIMLLTKVKCAYSEVFALFGCLESPTLFFSVKLLTLIFGLAGYVDTELFKQMLVNLGKHNAYMHFTATQFFELLHSLGGVFVACGTDRARSVGG